MDGNPAEPTGPDGAVSGTGDTSPWPRTGEFRLSYVPPPTDLGGGFVPSETSAIPLGPLYLQTPYREPADDISPAPPPGQQAPGHPYPPGYGQAGYPSPSPGSPYGQAPYGTPPYETPPYETPPYETPPYETSPYGTSADAASSYAEPPYPASPYSASPYSASPYDASPYDASPYGEPPHAAPPAAGSAYDPGFEAGTYGQAPTAPMTPWRDQATGWLAAPPEQPAWPPAGPPASAVTYGQPTGPVDSAADYGIPTSESADPWGPARPVAGPSPTEAGSWFSPAETGAIFIGPDPGPPAWQAQPSGAAAVTGAGAQPPDNYQDHQDPFALGVSVQGVPAAAPPDPVHPRATDYQTDYQVEFHAYQRTVYQQPPDVSVDAPYPVADPTAQTGAFPLYYAPPSTDLGGGGFAATDTSAIPIMPAAPAWADGPPTVAGAPGLASPDTAWPYAAWPAETAEPWPPAATARPWSPSASAAPAITVDLPAEPRALGAPADGPAVDVPTDGPAATTSPAAEPGGTRAKPAAASLTAGRPGGRRARRHRRRRVVLLAVSAILGVTIAGTAALAMVMSGGDSGDRNTLTAETIVPDTTQPRPTKTYPFPVIILTQRHGSGAPSPSAVGPLPPGGALGEALGSGDHLAAGSSPSVGKPPAPAAAPSATATPAARGNFPPAPPPVFPVPGS